MLHPLIGRGLAAAVYTQTTDVEVEVNGLMTYDREIIKLDVDRRVRELEKVRDDELKRLEAAFASVR